MDHDLRFRLAVFDYLNRLTFGDPEALVTWQDLHRFSLRRQAPRPDRRARHLETRRARPADLDHDLAAPIRPAGPYEDEIRADDTLDYAYQGEPRPG
ncbi:MAG: hypothetical protein R3F20_19000 [Planctomycetota bacterium]